MRFHWNANMILSWASDPCNVSILKAAVYEMSWQDHQNHSFNHTFIPRWPVFNKPHPSTQQNRLLTRTTDGHSRSPWRSASRENCTTQSARYLSSFAVSYLLDAPSPASQRIWIPWGRFPSYVPCAVGQQAIDLMICFKTKLLLENGNKLISQLYLNILLSTSRIFRVSWTVWLLKHRHMCIQISKCIVYLRSHCQKKCLFFLRNNSHSTKFHVS